MLSPVCESAVILFHPRLVGAAGYVFRPGGVVEIPGDGFAQAGFEAFGRVPAQFAFELAGVDGVAPVVARAVGDEADKLRVRGVGRLWAHFIEQRADGRHDVEIRPLVPAADVVRFARTARGEYGADGAAMIAHKQPVAHLAAIAIDGQRLAGEGVRDHQRNQLFRKVQRAVVVGAVGNQRGQAVGVVPGADQVVTRSLGCRVRAVGRVGGLLVESGVGGRERAVNLVGGDVQEAEPGAGRVVEGL